MRNSNSGKNNCNDNKNNVLSANMKGFGQSENYTAMQY